MIARIHGSIAFTSPRPIPRIKMRIDPAQSTRLSNENPVVAANRAVEDAIIAFIFAYIT